MCNALASTQKDNGYLSDPNSAVPSSNSPNAWQRGAGLRSGILSPIYFGLLQFLKGNQRTGQRHFREPCSNMRDEPGCNTHENNRAHTSRQDLGSEVKCWVLRIWWTQPVPFSSISSSDHLAPLLLWRPWTQLCLCGPIAPPWKAWQEDHKGQNISLHLGSFWGIFRERWQRYGAEGNRPDLYCSLIRAVQAG